MISVIFYFFPIIMLLFTKINFENVISIDVAKGIALLLRLILQGNGLKVAEKSPSNKSSVKSEFLTYFINILPLGS